ncbi:MAG: hypothetical protein M0C28_25250 [Candidatus Moduliflexus flocculans]|nr:hypothetical protein [Candidatus Moduliflexus flocculans]
MPTDLYRFLDAADETPALEGQRRAREPRYPRRLCPHPPRLDERRHRRALLPMPVRRVVANDAVAEDRGRVALQRGPLVYAVEGVDNGDRVFGLVLPDAASRSRAEFRPDLLNGVAVIKGRRNPWPFPITSGPTAAPGRCSSGCPARPPP